MNPISASNPSSSRRGKLFVIAAPSGAGKTSLVKALLERMRELHVSVSHTTRNKRPTEQHGREYYFVSVPEFQSLVEKNEFLEHARVFDNYYGTGRRPVEEQLVKGRKALPECKTIFILPPSRRALEERLRNRATDSNEVIERRLRDAVGDMTHSREFDYVVVNDDFEHAVSDLMRIVRGEGEDLRAGRATLQPLLSELLA